MKNTKNKKQTLSRRSMIKKGGLVLTPFLLGLGSCVGDKKKSFDADVML